MENRQQTSFMPRSLLVSLIYLALAAVWISFSDAVLELFVEDAGRMAVSQTYKGWFFVLVTALLLFLLLRRQESRTKRYVDGLLTGREALQVESASMRAILEACPVAIVVVEPSGIIAFANRRAGELLGLQRNAPEPANLLDLNWRAGRHRETESPADEHPARKVFLEGQSVRQVRQTLVRQDGPPLELLVDAAPIRDEKRQVSRVVCTFRDITGQPGAPVPASA